MKEKRFVTTPHIDIELGLERGQLEYFLTFPDNGVIISNQYAYFPFHDISPKPLGILTSNRVPRAGVEWILNVPLINATLSRIPMRPSPDPIDCEAN